MLNDEPQQIPVPPLSGDAPGQTLPLAAPPGETKKKRIRRTKAQIEADRKAEGAQTGEAPPDSEQSAKEAAAALSLTFKAVGAVIAAKRGDHWKLEQVECDSLGAAWAAVLAPYLEKYGQAVPIVGALAVTWSVAQSRISEDQRRAAIKRAQAAQDERPPAPAPALV